MHNESLWSSFSYPKYFWGALIIEPAYEDINKLDGNKGVMG
ncbi:MAG: hypothetical protein ISEC1_P0301 [Thiomicrorhabdus sp.]|nr:MAG: hypothetical protein ISEC1_P0301 [Thiomicrorhabdus sp.]